MLTLDKIYHAAFVPKEAIRQTDMIPSHTIRSDVELYIKTANLQVTGELNVRGAYSNISTL